MSKTHRYVLVLDTQCHGSSGVHSLLAQLRCPVFIAGTVEQALAKAHQTTPYLVILIGDGRNWSQSLVEQLRQGVSTAKMTIVALTDSTSPRWGHQDENPGLDGFLVKPLSGEVLTSLVESALAKQDAG
jgi:DNA-binding NarL/FixJ family response regulator